MGCGCGSVAGQASVQVPMPPSWAGFVLRKLHLPQKVYSKPALKIHNKLLIFPKLS